MTDLNSSTIHLLHRAGQCVNDVFSSSFDETNEQITPRQYAVLTAVSQEPGASQTRLVEMTGIDRSTLADIVKRLVKRGLIKRKRTKEDERAYAVDLTSVGEERLRSLTPSISQIDKDVLSALPTARRQEFLRDLTTIIESLSAKESTDAA